MAIGSYAGKREEIFAQWSAAIHDLATCPNVVVKVGGMAMRINGWDFHEQPDPPSSDVVAFGSTVTFGRADGRVQTYRIVGEDEADPKAGSISFVSPVAKLLMGKAVGEFVGAGDQEIEIIAIALMEATTPPSS